MGMDTSSAGPVSANLTLLPDTFTRLMPPDGIEIREGYADVGDVTLHYVEAGEGRWSFCCTGSPSSGSAGGARSRRSLLPASVLWGNSVLWGTSTIWGSSVLWGTSVLWGCELLPNSSVLWGSSVVWGSNVDSGYSVLWGSSVLWGLSNLSALSDGDADAPTT